METIENRPELVNVQADADVRAEILIGDDRYEIPRLDELDLDEEQILYDFCETGIPDFMPAHPESPPEIQHAIALLHVTRTRNPAFKRALVIIAYRREHRDMPVDEISTLIGSVNAFDAELALYGKAEQAAEEDAAKADPPRST